MSERIGQVTGTDNSNVFLDSEYREWIKRLGSRIRSAQVKAAIRVNSELLRLYWAIGEELAEKAKTAKWGDGWLEATSRDLLSEFPEMRGFSFRNLKSIRQWYTFYASVEIGKQPVSRWGEVFFSVPWGHHLYILQRSKTIDKALFYLRKTVENNWSRSVLLNFLDTDLYEREGKAIGLLICKTKDNVFAKYALESTNQPIGISEYELSKIYPEKVEGTIPTVEEIESRLLEIDEEAR